jgi:hypothetical protein
MGESLADLWVLIAHSPNLLGAISAALNRITFKRVAIRDAWQIVKYQVSRLPLVALRQLGSASAVA